ncbi:uncharacterized protein BXZ73DRAFT_103507 [Epithele typhae]|uniref:uncharacterized protein n=1 Tax=Epithele typhae TaxID=378194 RepID=UPI00200887D9|nr:uncharacterized protein BXZ73DRAFT_103507 [Epithele typhae]KAH9924667.1 hypothetical protein BXZ73DRAFT_103507 [Epithele typhae]
MILSSPAVRKIADADVDEVTQLFVHSLDLSIPGVTFSTDPQYAALDLVAASLRKRLFPPRSREAYVLEDPATGALLGYGNVKPEGGPAGDADELDMFFVKASEGGKGYGGLLMKAVQAEFAGAFG